MSEITISAKKFLRLFDYIDRVGLDMDQIIAAVNILPERVAQLNPQQGLPAQQYSRLYRAAVRQMETLGEPIPWADPPETPQPGEAQRWIPVHL